MPFITLHMPFTTVEHRVETSFFPEFRQAKLLLVWQGLWLALGFTVEFWAYYLQVNIPSDTTGITRGPHDTPNPSLNPCHFVSILENTAAHDSQLSDLQTCGICRTVEMAKVWWYLTDR